MVFILVLATCPLQYVWRIALGFGAIPPLLLAYKRYQQVLFPHAPSRPSLLSFPSGLLPS